MSRRYTYARTIEGPDGPETFTAEQFDSFDEAKGSVDKGVYDRKLQIGQEIIEATKNAELAKRTDTKTPQTPTGGTATTGDKTGQ